MRTLRLSLTLFVSTLMLVAAVAWVPAAHIPRALAQDGDQCLVLATDTINAARAACAGLAPGEACTTSGEKSMLAEVDSLVTMGADPATGDWGLTMLALPANLPEGEAVTAVLYGEAQITRPAQTTSDRPTVVVSAAGSAPINLRDGAGVTYALVGQLEAGVEAIADGRNEQADWVRIQFGDAMAWVFTPLIRWEGDDSALQALEVLLPNDVTPVFVADAGPLQAFNLTTVASPCEAAPAGLVLQYTGETAARVVVNQTTLEFTNATLILTAVANEALEIKVLTGGVTATARGIAHEASVGQALSVTLGGEDGLTPAAPPSAAGSYTFPTVAYAPLALLPNSTVCMAGLPASNAIVQLRVGPGEQRGALGTMNASVTYPVLGQANDPDGNPWWQLDTTDTPSWVAQNEVRLMGDCALVAEVEPPPLVFAAPSVPAGDTSSAGADSGAPDFSPVANTVWQMRPGSDNLSGECSGAPAINFCDHLAAIAPTQGGISWRGMEPSPYYLSRIQPNVYAYAGPNILGTGTINMTLTFNNEGNLSMTMSLVLSSEPNCTHVYYYTGSKNW